jgi:hypothetical protein
MKRSLNRQTVIPARNGNSTLTLHLLFAQSGVIERRSLLSCISAHVARRKGLSGDWRIKRDSAPVAALLHAPTNAGYQDDSGMG